MRSVSQQRRIARYGLYLIAPFFVWLIVVGYNRSLPGSDRCVVRVVDGNFEMLDREPFELVARGEGDDLHVWSKLHAFTLTHRASLKLPDEYLQLVIETDGWAPKRHNVWYQLLASQKTQLPYRCEPSP